MGIALAICEPGAKSITLRQEITPIFGVNIFSGKILKFLHFQFGSEVSLLAVVLTQSKFGRQCTF